MAAKKRKGKETTEAPAVEEAPKSSPKTRKKIKVASQEYKLLPPDSVTLHPENPRRGNVSAIAESLEANDFYGAAVVQKSTNYVLVGNHRIKAAREQGLTEVPVIVVDCDDATAERIMLADNRIAELAKYDEQMLVKLLDRRAAEHDLVGTGYQLGQLEKLHVKASPPEQLPTFTEKSAKLRYRCPKCAFEWV